MLPVCGVPPGVGKLTRGGEEATPLNLDGMTKAQLLSFAKENNISGVSSSMLKADILSTIEGAVQ